MRSEFPAKVRLAAIARGAGICECHLLGKAGIPGFSVEGCGVKITPGNLYFEHIIPDAAGGRPTLDNCAAVTKTCGSLKSRSYDAPKVAKVRHQTRSKWGIEKRKSRPMPGSKASGWKRGFDGKAVRR